MKKNRPYRLRPPTRARWILIALTPLLILLASCDAGLPDHDPRIVVEAWIDSGQELPRIRISKTHSVGTSLNELDESHVDSGSDIQVSLTMAGQVIPFSRIAGTTDRFGATGETNPTPEPGDAFELTVQHALEQAKAHGVMPPLVRLLHASAYPADEPVPVVLVDSLQLGLDSLSLDVPATTGFIYPIQVSVSWVDEQFDGWIEARLEPSAPFSSSLIDFFLLPTEVFPEPSASVLEDGLLTWDGVYAVPVATMESPLPDHTLKITLIRGDDAFARFTTSRSSPERRDPLSNVDGGLGFVGGISVDSLRIDVTRR